jgi:hypothetical protein
MVIEQYPQDVEKLNEFHAYDIFCRCISNAADNLWSHYFSATNTNDGRCLDNMLRERLFTAPGEGICYLCLLLASEIPITATFEEEIELSRELCPVLPFPDHLQNTLLKIVGKEQRLRLAMCLAQNLGRSCNKLKLKLEANHFKSHFLDLLRELTSIDDHQSVFDELNVIIECLRCSTRRADVIDDLPPSPAQHRYDC